MPQHSSMRPIDWVALVTLSVGWALSYLMFRLMIRYLPPITLTFARVSMGFVFLWLIIRLRGWRMPRGWRLWRNFAVMGVLNNVVPFVSISLAARHITSGQIGILIAATPAFTALTAAVMGAEKLTPARAAGVALGFAGVAVLIGPAALHSGFSGAAVTSQLICLMAAFFFALAGLFGRCFTGLAPIPVAAGMLAASSLILLPLMLVVDHPWQLPLGHLALWIEILVMGAACTAGPFLLYFFLLARTGPTNTLLVTFLSPVSALMLGSVFLGETILPRALVGMVVIAAGLAAMDGRLLRLWRRRRAAG